MSWSDTAPGPGGRARCRPSRAAGRPSPARCRPTRRRRRTRRRGRPSPPARRRARRRPARSARSGGAANARPAAVRRTGISPAAHSWTTTSSAAGDAAGLEPGVARPERRVAGEGQLPPGREDPHPVVGAGLRRREHERRLRQVRPVGDPLHRGVVEPVAVEHDGDRVPAERHLGEHVDLPKPPLHPPSLPAPDARSADPFPRRIVTLSVTIPQENRSAWILLRICRR